MSIDKLDELHETFNQLPEGDYDAKVTASAILAIVNVLVSKELITRNEFLEEFNQLLKRD